MPWPLTPTPPPIGFLGWLLALYGEWDQGLAILKKAMELNPHFPAWFHLAPFVYFYSQERYEEAYQEAQQFHLPRLFWDPLLRAATLSRLGKEPEAAQAAAELLQLRPDFSTCGRFLISCFIKFDYLRDAIIDGLRQAGLSL